MWQTKSIVALIYFRTVTVTRPILDLSTILKLSKTWRLYHENGVIILTFRDAVSMLSSAVPSNTCRGTYTAERQVATPPAFHGNNVFSRIRFRTNRVRNSFAIRWQPYSSVSVEISSSLRRCFIFGTCSAESCEAVRRSRLCISPSGTKRISYFLKTTLRQTRRKASPDP